MSEGTLVAAFSAVDDLLGGDETEWCNIQDIVRTSFKALLELVKQQGESIKVLQHRLDEKASWADVNAALEQKASVADVNHSLSRLTHEVDGKCSPGDARELVSEATRAAKAMGDGVAEQLETVSTSVQRKIEAETHARLAGRDEVDRLLDAKASHEAVESMEVSLGRKVRTGGHGVVVCVCSHTEPPVSSLLMSSADHA